MNKRTTIKALLILILMISNIAIAQQVTNTKVELLANQFLTKTKLPGLQIAVSKNGQLIYSNSFGFADIKSKIKMTNETRLRTASVSKVITATAIGRLVSQDKIDLDAPIKNYIPYINSSYANLTIRELAGHTSGLANNPKGNAYKKKQYNSIKKSIELLDAPLLFKPNTNYKYSTFAYNLLAGVIEGASGLSYEKYMKDSIFKPLNMQNTMPENINKLTKNDAKLYFFKKNKLRLDNYVVNGSYKLAGAGFRSTATDLVNMMNAYQNGFISKNVVTEMFSSNILENGNKTSVGISWRQSYDAFGYKVIEHAGYWQGARTVVVHFPEHQLSISLMTNARASIFIEETAHIFAQLFIKKSESEPLINTINRDVEVSISLSNGTIKKFKGNLNLKNGNGVLKVDRKENFINTNPIYYFGNNNEYIISTTFGLLILKMDKNLNGKVYLYSSRNKENPINICAVVSFIAK